jgi:hypothetical protein
MSKGKRNARKKKQAERQAAKNAKQTQLKKNDRWDKKQEEKYNSHKGDLISHLGDRLSLYNMKLSGSSIIYQNSKFSYEILRDDSIKVSSKRDSAIVDLVSGNLIDLKYFLDGVLGDQNPRQTRSWSRGYPW